MSLLVWYLVFVIVGDIGLYFVGLFVEYEWGSSASLAVFLLLYFVILWVAWFLAVWASKPRSTINVSGKAPA